MGIDNPFFEAGVNRILEEFETGKREHIARESAAPM
jgi:hypothetical protein